MPPPELPEPSAPTSPSPAAPLRRRLSDVSFAATLSAALALAAVYLFVGDRTAWGEFLTIWPPALWCFALVPLALPTLDRRRPGRLLALLAVIAAFVASTTEWTTLARRWASPEGSRFEALRDHREDGPADSAEASATMALRIVSWNVNGASEGIAAIERQEPDLCFLQEAPGAESLARALKSGGPLDGFHMIHDDDCALLSRFPMRRLPSARVGPWSDPVLAALDLPSGRTLLAVDVRLMLPSLVLNPFSSAARESLAASHRDRVAQFPRLARLVEDAGQAAGARDIILAGDFNTPGAAASLAPLRAALRDVWPVAGCGWGGTMTNDFPVSRIDQCWVGGAARPVRARVLAAPESDHRMLVVDLFL